MRWLLLSIFLISSMHGLPWGFAAHKSINYLACFKLPIEMFGFYKQHIHLIKEWAVKADQRRYIVEDEGIGHYIDLDHYEHHVPLDTVPRYWNPAIDSFSQDSVKAYGILPWRVMSTFYNLQRSFESLDLDRIIKYSSDLGHYVADAHVPLHTTENYNGQLTNQHGIHGLWESRLPELFMEQYSLIYGDVQYLEDPLETIWDIIEESFAAKDSVLLLENQISLDFEHNKYSFENRGSSVVKVYSVDFCKAYNASLNGMVERRMLQSIKNVASFWYTAWVNAGQPQLFQGPLKEIGPQMQADSFSIDSFILSPPRRTLLH